MGTTPETAADGPWARACGLDELPVGEPVAFKQDGHRVALVRLDDGTVHALEDSCPHEGYPLTKGSVSGEVLTCCWHNFKFDLRSGRCARGEAARVYPLRVRDGFVEVALAPPDPIEARAQRLRSLTEALEQDRPGQAAREVVRLLRLGVTPAALALEAAVFDATRGVWGTTHGLPTAVDALAMAARYPGERAVWPLMQAFELVADAHVRRPTRGLPEPVDPGRGRPVEVGARLRALVEAEDSEQAQALLRGALARGWRRAEVEPWFIGLCCDHFVDFGHGLIYTIKVFDLLEQTGWERADALLTGLLWSILSGTREDALPEWLWYRRWCGGRLPEVEAALGRALAAGPDAAGPVAPDAALVAALLDGRREAALDAVADALGAGVGLAALTASLITAAAHRMLRFDLAHDASDQTQEGWLDVTHLLTFASATRHALRRHPTPESARLIVQAARFINSARPLDGAASADGSIAPIAGDLDDLDAAIERRDPDAAVAITAGLLGGPDASDGLRGLVDRWILSDRWTRPIVIAHLIKTAAVVFEEQARLGPDHPAPTLALARLLAAPLRERWLSRSCHEALRLVVEGKVPRTLT